jgi:hypothetical protein
VPKSPKTESGREAPPTKFPEVPPTTYAESVGSAWLMEAVMQMEQSIGELKATVAHLNTSSEKHSTKLDRISHVIFAAGVVLAIILAIGGFFLNKIWDGVFTLLTKAPLPPMPPTP